jgi:hypothetical protein
LIPSDIKWDPNATPPQFTNNEDTVIEPGTHVRVKIIGTRTEVGEMWAIGSIKEDYLGYAFDGWGVALVSIANIFSQMPPGLIMKLMTDELAYSDCFQSSLSDFTYRVELEPQKHRPTTTRRNGTKHVSS